MAVAGDLGGEEPDRFTPEGVWFLKRFLESKSLGEEGSSSLEDSSWSLDVNRASAETCYPEICE